MGNKISSEQFWRQHSFLDLWEGNGEFDNLLQSVGRGPGALFAADFDNDSKMDLWLDIIFLSVLTEFSLTGDFSLTLSDTSSKLATVHNILCCNHGKRGSAPQQL
ncbi:MAG: hypothetical protein Ct9H300mP21_02260 [Pseudomonadota bacterium]|nr:MAG: hypothetical protein Ct9H300mP21_02260 [Pseudomonadota bacterium]